ncbi:MAG: transporter substrate-binding domain-containing protein, partial [Oscillospiraceae bacterium]
MNRILKQILSGFLTVVVLLSISADIFAISAEDNRVIKVGILDFKGFSEEDSDGNYSGYGIEYLNEIKKYNPNWTYEFIKGDWSNLMVLLRNKKIDLVCTAKYSPQRDGAYNKATNTGGYSYSNQSIGQMLGTLYTTNNNKDIYYNDYKKLAFTKIGFLKDSLNIYMFEDFMRTFYNSNYQISNKTEDSQYIKFYANETQLTKALENGEIEALATEHIAYHDNLRLIAKYGSVPFYFMSYYGNDIMPKINSALSTIKSNNYSFEIDLYEKYYKTSSVHKSPLFTREEVEYIKNSPILKVGVNSNIKPMTYNDEKTGELVGINIDIIKKISEISGLKFDFVGLNGQNTKYEYEYFKNNNIDIIAGIEVNEFNQNIKGLTLTNKYFSAQKSLVTRQGEYVSKFDNLKIAIVGGSGTLPFVIKKNFPNSQVVVYTKIEECLDAVKNKQADALLYNQYLLENHLSRPYYEQLCVISGLHISESVALSPVDYSNFNEDKQLLLSNPKLISILNKSIDLISENDVQGIIIEHTVAHRKNLSLND